MELREKVTISLVIIALTQIACRHCMPRTPRKASLKRYLNDLKPVKNNPASTLYSPSKVNKIPKQTFGKTAQNGRIGQNSLPKQSLFNTYNFPEIEYPLDNAPRDPFRIGMNFNENNNVNTLLKARNLQSSAINDLKKEMKMKRKLLSNKQMNNENIPLKTDMSSIKITSNPDSVSLLDPETFPEVQYPLNTMETWGQNYWNYLPFTQEKQLNGLGQQAFNPKPREGINQPFTRLTKAKASKFLQSYDKLKDEHRRTSTENSKRSSVGQKGLNFTKTATCERDSDDFITAGLLSNTLVNPSDTKTLEANNAENTCSLIENPYHPMPLPYKVIEENIENVCPAFQLKNNTQELEDVDSSVIYKTLQLIEEILLNGDTSSKVPPKNKNKEKDNNVNTTETDYTGGSANKDIPINPIDNAETSTVEPIEELSQEISDDAQADILPYNLPSLPEETIPENTTIVAGPCQNVRIPLPFTDSITYSALTNASSPDLTNTTTLSNVNTVPGYTSIIIIPMNNDAVGKSHMFDTTSDTPIIVYLPSTQTSSIPSQAPPLNHIVSSSLGSPVTNNQPYNILSNMASVQNDNPSSTALVSELLNSISDSGSSLPIHETLPTNSKCYNNENSPSSMREKPVSNILIHKSLIDDAPFVTPSCDEILCQQPVETDNFDTDPETLPPTLDFEHPMFNFADHDIAREIDSDQQSNDTSSKDLFIARQNITTEHLHKTNSLGSVSDDSFSQSPNGVPTVAKDFSSETPTDSPEILKNLDPSDSLSKLPVSTNKPIFLSPISKQISESLQSIDEMPPTLLADTPTVKLPPPTEASLTPTALSKTFFDKLPEIRDTKVSNTIVSDITSESAPQPIDNNPMPSPILNSTPMTTDLTVKTELYKIRQILDRMLSSETPTVNRPPSMDLTLSPISETDSLPLLVNQSLSPIQTPTDRQLPPLGKVLPPLSDTDSVPLLEEQSLSPIQTPTDSQPAPVDKVLSPIQTPTDRQPPPLDNVLSPIQTPTDSQLPPLDKVLSPISDTDSLPLLENRSLSPIQTTTDSHPPPLSNVLSPIQTPTDGIPPPLYEVLSSISDTDSLPLLENRSLSPIQTTTHSQPPSSGNILSPNQTPTDGLPPPLYEVLSSIQTPIDRQPPPLDKILSPIQTPTDSQPPPLIKVLSPISDTDSVPLLEEQSLSPIQTPTDSQPAPVDKILAPIQTPTDRQSPPLDKVLPPISETDSVPLLEEQSLSPIPTATDSQLPPVDKVLSPIQTPTDRQPPPLDKVLPPISDTDSVPLLEEQSLSPIQTPTDSQPLPLDNVLSPIQTPTDSQSPPLDKVLSPISDTDSLPLLENRSSLPIETTTDSQPPPLEKVLPPILDTGSVPLLEEQTLSPIQTPTDSQPAPVDKALSPIQTPTDSQPAPVDKILAPIQTPTDRQSPPLDKVLPPISETDSVPLLEEQSLSPIPTATDSQLPPVDKVLSPIQTPTDRQPPPLDKVLPPISDTDSVPLLEEQSLSPIQTPTDSQPLPLDNVLSPIQTPTDSQSPPLDKVLSPISDTDSLPLLENRSSLPIETTTDSQPPPLEKVLPPILDTGSVPLLEEQTLSPIQTPTDSQPAPVDKVLSPIQKPTDRQPLPLDNVLSPIQTPTDSQPAPVDKVLSPIQTPTDRQPLPLDNVLAPIQTPTDSQSPPLDKVLSPISDTDSLPLLENRSLPPIETTTDSQPPPLDKVLPPISDTGSAPLLEEQTLSPIQTPTDSQPAPVDKVLSPIQTPTDRQPTPLVKVLSPISDTDSLPLLKEQSLSPIHTLNDSQPAPLDDVLSPIQTPTDRHSPPLVKVLPPISDTDSVPLLEEQALSPIQTPINSQSPPLDKVLSPISDTDSLPLLEEQSLSPIQTPTDSQPAPVDKILAPISDTDSLSENQSLSPIQTPTDSQPAPIDDVLSPILTPTDSQSPSLDKVLSPISDTDSLPLLENRSLSPIQTNTDSQPPPLGNVLSPFQTPTDGLPPPLYEVLSSIQTPTDSQPPPLAKVLSPISDTDRLPLLEEQSLSPIQTPTDSQPLPLDKVLPLNSDTDSLPLLENQSLSPNQTPTDSGPLLAVTDYRIDSLQLQDHETVLETPIDYDSKDTLPSLMDKSYLLNSVLENTESQAQSLEEIVSPIPLFETTIDNKPYLIDNLVTPLYEAVTSRNKDITKNGLPHKMDDLTFKMDLEFPDMYEVYNDDRPLSVDELPIKVHQENSESPLWMVDLPMDVVETPNLLSKTLVSDLVKQTEMLSLPVEGVLEIVSPGFPSHSDMSLMSDSREIDHFPPSKDVSDDMPALPMDEFKSPIHEVIPNSQSNETSEIQPQKYDLPLRVDKLIPDISLSDALSNEPFEIDDSPSPVTDKIPEIPNSTANTKDPPLIDNRLLSPEDDASPDTLVTDIPTTVLPSLNEALQSTNLDKTSDEVYSESTLSNLHRDNLPLPNNKTLPLPDNILTNLLPSYKTLSSSKLPITKALLENVLSDITKGALSSKVAKALPVTPPSDKTVYYVDEKSPLYETKGIPLQPVENSFSNAEDNDNLIDNLHVSQITEDIPTKDLPVEFQLPMDKMYNDSPEISTDDAGGDNENDTQTSNKLSDDQPLPNDKISPLTDILRDISRNEKSSSTKLPITKALLENVLSEINTKGFSIPVSKAVSATSTSVGDKTHYYIDSPHSDFTEDSPPLPEDKILPNTAHTDNNLPFSGQSEDILPLEEDKTLSEIQRIDISTEISSPMDKKVANDDRPSAVTEIVSFPKDAPSDSQLPNHKNKTHSSSKLPIAKALLENVLSDINTKGFSLPVAKALPIASRTQLDKTLYFLESPRPDTTVKSIVSDDPIENEHYSEINEDVLPPSADKVVPDNPIIDIPTDELISGKMYEDNSDDLTEELEDSEETLEKPLSPDDLPDELSVPPTKQLFSSRLPITKALLQKVLSDITNGGLQPKIS